ncbi:transposase [Erythrobacter sp. NFXS35]|uniref:transposase n=1 Tax=Erythrobacter sp. NFXS35 TaxID=2818436 RepID=UPI0032DFDCE7
MFLVMTGQLKQLNEQVALLDRTIARRACEVEAARRLMTTPGIGPITATALLALAPPVEGIARGRDFAVWLGLMPRRHSSGGMEWFGAISRMAERTLRRLLIIGSSAVVLHASKARCSARLMARADAGQKAAHAGHVRVGEQDRPDHLGVSDEGRAFQQRLQDSGRGSSLS